MALNMLIYDLLKTSWNDVLILWNMKIHLRWDQYNYFGLEGDRRKQPNWLVPFHLKTVWIFVYIIFLFKAWNESGKVGLNTNCYWYSLLWPLIFNLSILKVACQKKRRWMGGAERVGQRITSEVRWDQSHLIPLLSPSMNSLQGILRADN